MLLPSIFGENLFDDMMNFDFDKEFERMGHPLYGKHAQNMSRTFYVGEQLTEQDIQAKFENGILQLTVPKKEAKQVEGHKYIAIE